MTTETTTPTTKKYTRRKYFRIHIKGGSDEIIREELRELTDIVVAMREAQKKWKDEFGATNRARAVEIEKLADEWISKHKVFYYTEKSAGE